MIDGDGGFYKGNKGAQIKLLCRAPGVDTIITQLQQDLPYPSSVWKEKHPTTEGLFNIIIGKGRSGNNFQFLYNKFYMNKSYLTLQRKKEALKAII